jgi:hypothetical protein
MILNKKQEVLCDGDVADFSGLSAVIGTLKRPTEALWPDADRDGPA